MLDALLHLDLKNMHMVNKAGVLSQKVTFLAVLLDDQGAFVAGQEGVIDLAMKEDRFQKLSVEGLEGGFRVEAPLGKYRLRTVVEEASEGRITTGSQAVELR